MIWLSRNTKILNYFSTQKWEVNVFSTWSVDCVFEFNDIQCNKHNDVPTIQDKRTNIVPVNCSTCSYFFLKQNDMCLLKLLLTSGIPYFYFLQISCISFILFISFTSFISICPAPKVIWVTEVGVLFPKKSWKSWMVGAFFLKKS